MPAKSRRSRADLYREILGLEVAVHQTYTITVVHRCGSVTDAVHDQMCMWQHDDPFVDSIEVYAAPVSGREGHRVLFAGAVFDDNET